MSERWSTPRETDPRLRSAHGRGHVAPPSKVEFEVKAEHECPEGGVGELSIGVEPGWSESATETEGSIE
ncbi:amphi-Trp domain-containing protein [Haloarcula sp. H-GB5]